MIAEFIKNECKSHIKPPAKINFSYMPKGYSQFMPYLSHIPWHIYSADLKLNQTLKDFSF